MGRSAVRGSIRVLESFRTPGPSSNPYLSLLIGALPADRVEALTFTWPRALLGRYDVLHVHWTEALVGRRNWARSLITSVAFALVLVRCRLLRVAIVRTRHNVRPHEQQRPWVGVVVALCDRWATWWIALNDSPDGPQPATTIVHGHYRDWYPAATSPATPGRLLLFGLLRPYKGIERLLEAFADVSDAGLTLRIVGRPADTSIGAAARAAAAADRRVTVDLRHVPDDELAVEITAAALVVLPYRDLHSSGALLLALSLDRPVLVPRNPVTDALAAEVGEWWVQRYVGDLDADDLERAAATVRGGPREPVDLSRRDWDVLGAQHADVFDAAVDRARSRGRGRPVAAGGMH